MQGLCSGEVEGSADLGRMKAQARGEEALSVSFSVSSRTQCFLGGTWMSSRVQACPTCPAYLHNPGPKLAQGTEIEAAGLSSVANSGLLATPQ